MITLKGYLGFNIGYHKRPVEVAIQANIQFYLLFTRILIGDPLSAKSVMAVGRMTVVSKDSGNTETSAPLTTTKYFFESLPFTSRHNIPWSQGGPSPTSLTEPPSQFEAGLFFMSTRASALFSKTDVISSASQKPVPRHCLIYGNVSVIAFKV